MKSFFMAKIVPIKMNTRVPAHHVEIQNASRPLFLDVDHDAALYGVKRYDSAWRRRRHRLGP